MNRNEEAELIESVALTCMQVKATRGDAARAIAQTLQAHGFVKP